MLGSVSFSSVFCMTSCRNDIISTSTISLHLVVTLSGVWNFLLIVCWKAFNNHFNLFNKCRTLSFIFLLSFDNSCLPKISQFYLRCRMYEHKIFHCIPLMLWLGFFFLFIFFYFLNACGVYSNVPSFIPEINNFYLLFSWSDWLKFYQFQ